MPELPEVETVRLGLAPVLEGHVLTDVETRRGNLRIPFPPDFVGRTRGRKVKALRRRAKYLLADLDSGETLVIHLGMSGRMSVYAEGKQRRLGNYVYNPAPDGAGHGKHDHVVFETDAPARIVFNDHRRFGLMTLVDTERLEDRQAVQGHGDRTLIAQIQRRLSGQGAGRQENPHQIGAAGSAGGGGPGQYLCLRGAVPRRAFRPSGWPARIKSERIAPLVTAIKKVLKDAIAAGGSTLRDHAQATGDPGDFQHHFLVYGREGKPCKSASSSEGHKKNGCPGR